MDPIYQLIALASTLIIVPVCILAPVHSRWPYGLAIAGLCLSPVPYLPQESDPELAIENALGSFFAISLVSIYFVLILALYTRARWQNVGKLSHRLTRSIAIILIFLAPLYLAIFDYIFLSPFQK